MHWRAFILDRGSAKRFDRVQAAGAWFSFGLYVTIFVSGFLSPDPGLYMLAGTDTWLLFSGANEAWLLLTIGDDSLKAPEKKRLSLEFTAWVAERAEAIHRGSPIWARAAC